MRAIIYLNHSQLSEIQNFKFSPKNIFPFFFLLSPHLCSHRNFLSLGHETIIWLKERIFFSLKSNKHFFSSLFFQLTKHTFHIILFLNFHAHDAVDDGKFLIFLINICVDHRLAHTKKISSNYQLLTLFLFLVVFFLFHVRHKLSLLLTAFFALFSCRLECKLRFQLRDMYWTHRDQAKREEWTEKIIQLTFPI